MILITILNDYKNEAFRKGFHYYTSSLFSILLRFCPLFTNITKYINGGVSKQIRYVLGRRIFKYCGKNVNIERGACFGSGRLLEIGDNSGLGINCNVPSNIKIGKDVMMGPNCYILYQNHRIDDVSTPMNRLGFVTKGRTIIEDDVWIGRNVTFTPGRHVSKGTVIGACCLLCKDFPEYSVVGGNPSEIIRSRLNER